MKEKFILFSPWLLKSPVIGFCRVLSGLVGFFGGALQGLVGVYRVLWAKGLFATSGPGA